jgi:hypothetical protein
VNASILLGYTEAMRRRPQASGLGRGPDHSGEADLVLFLVIQTHSSRRDEASDPFCPYAGAGLGRSPSIRAGHQPQDCESARTCRAADPARTG